MGILSSTNRNAETGRSFEGAGLRSLGKRKGNHQNCLGSPAALPILARLCSKMASNQPQSVYHPPQQKAGERKPPQNAISRTRINSNTCLSFRLSSLGLVFQHKNPNQRHLFSIWAPLPFKNHPQKPKGHPPPQTASHFMGSDSLPKPPPSIPRPWDRASEAFRFPLPGAASCGTLARRGTLARGARGGGGCWGQVAGRPKAPTKIVDLDKAN